MILKCKCNHKQQDKLNGDKMRVMNKTTKELAGKTLYRCSVCEQERTAS